jgi:hypothetical protein
MMNVRNFLIAIVTITGSFASFGQSNLLNAKLRPNGLKTAANSFLTTINR